MIAPAPVLTRPGTPAAKDGAVMLVSARADAALRADVAAGLRPMPEYLVLERDHGMTLLDWSLLRAQPTSRTLTASLLHTATGVRAARKGAVLSDGEHLGLPLAAATAALPRRQRHVVIGHHLTTPAKRRLLAVPGLRRGIDRVIVHSVHQRTLLVDETPLGSDAVDLVRYGVDTAFWSPADVPPTRARHVVAAGREHRDYLTLAEAVGHLEVDVFVAVGSTHSPTSTSRVPSAWPRAVTQRSVDPVTLREHYSQACVVVVPLVETDFPAGITVVLEAMAMGKPVVVSDTPGMRGAIADADAVQWVPPGDSAALRRVLTDLMADEGRRAALGGRARAVAHQHHDVRRFAADVAARVAPPRQVAA